MPVKRELYARDSIVVTADNPAVGAGYGWGRRTDDARSAGAAAEALASGGVVALTSEARAMTYCRL